jgi:hypothetical protein
VRRSRAPDGRAVSVDPDGRAVGVRETKPAPRPANRHDRALALIDMIGAVEQVERQIPPRRGGIEVNAKLRAALCGWGKAGNRGIRGNDEAGRAMKDHAAQVTPGTQALRSLDDRIGAVKRRTFRSRQSRPVSPGEPTW